MKAMTVATVALAGLLCMGADQCGTTTTLSDSGVTKTSVKIQTGPDGLTAEQRNIRERLVEDNRPGAIKHLYIISPYSGQVILYSTVKGKVTSGSKRINPSSIAGNRDPNDYCTAGQNVLIGGRAYCTTEVLADDGAYGSSGDYLYWWDVQGRYHQHYLGNEILHISDQPLPVKSIIINLAVQNER